VDDHRRPRHVPRWWRHGHIQYGDKQCHRNGGGRNRIDADQPITLSGLTYNTPYTQNIIGTNSLILTNSGATFNVQLSAQSTPTLFQLANVISAPISGGGTFGLTKTGPGVLTLTGTNTYTGGTRINGGTLALTGTTGGDAALGATGAGNGIFFDGGVLLNNFTGGFTTARDVVLGAGGGTFRLFTALTVNGIISGSGPLRKELTGALTLTGANTYTGTTTQTVGTMTVGGANGTIATSSGYDMAGTLNLDNSQFNNNNRISDTATITSRGMTMALTGNASAATSELAGALNLSSGNTTLTVTPNAAQAASLNFASISRLNNSTLFIRGTNLGSAAAAGVASITSVSAPGALIGGGGAAGTTTQSILPYAVGNRSATATLGSTHVTYDSVGGNLRPLLTTEYATTLGANPTDNVRLTASTTAPADSTVNALLFAPGAAGVLSGGTINITSGSFLYSPTATATGTVSANLNFGAAEGFIHTSNTLGISGVISGSGGLTINPFAGSTVTLSGQTPTRARLRSTEAERTSAVLSRTAGPARSVPARRRS
jgi:autotransporter-associated beta strand protein